VKESGYNKKSFNFYVPVKLKNRLTEKNVQIGKSKKSVRKSRNAAKKS